MSPSTTVTHIYNTSRPADSTTSLGKRVRQCRAWTQHRGASTEKSTVCLATKPKKYPLDQRGGHTETNCCSPLATALQPALWAACALHSSQQGSGARPRGTAWLGFSGDLGRQGPSRAARGEQDERGRRAGRAKAGQEREDRA